jgi:NAD+ kinase
MKVLIVTKTTNYELHGQVIGENIKQGRVSSDALSRLVLAHDEHYATLEKLKEQLDDYDIDYEEISRDSDWRWDGTSGLWDAVLSVGGDGTLLAASHNILQPGRLIGVRSSESSVGYLCCAGMQDIGKLVSALAGGTIAWQQVSRVQAEIRKAEADKTLMTVPVLNDLLYTNANPAATTRYKIRFRDRSETHRSSGIWVATGVGSTAAILAAGGERRPQDDRLFQFRVRELYKLGHKLPEIEGGLFDPAEDLFEIENRCPEAILATDGQHGYLELTYGDTFTLKRGPDLLLARPF